MPSTRRSSRGQRVTFEIWCDTVIIFSNLSAHPRNGGGPRAATPRANSDACLVRTSLGGQTAFVPLYLYCEAEQMRLQCYVWRPRGEYQFGEQEYSCHVRPICSRVVVTGHHRRRQSRSVAVADWHVLRQYLGACSGSNSVREPKLLRCATWFPLH